ncbi:MAG: tRNA (N(6)-L-threonylcarbamoyladenosine(37)-C(2))-methylthiotransferase MtaB [Pseudomonadota bacterium]
MSEPNHRPSASPRVITMGCRLNGYESEAMRAIGAEVGLSDAVVINSCAVTNEAVRQTRQNIRRARRASPDARLVVTGCAAQINPEAFAAMPEVDAVLGNAEKLDANAWRALAEGDAMRVNDIMSVRETANHLIDGYGDRARAFLQIQNGCDHRCTFCIIPYGRGNSRSTPIEEVVAQARRLTAAGHRELVLTGVDITSYGGDLDGAPSLGDLVAALLDDAPDLYRLRLSSIDGAEIDDAFKDLIATEERIAPHLHLSLQAGDDMILKRMKRRHTRSQAIEFCRDLRARRPDIAFGADIIVGFPTETEEMFQRSLDLVDEAGLQYLHVFPFSPREGTPAAKMPQTPRDAIKERARRLRAKGEEALAQFLTDLQNQRFQAVVESGGRARLGNFAEVKLDPPHPDVGAVVDVAITGQRDGALLGAPIL